MQLDRTHAVTRILAGRIEADSQPGRRDGDDATLALVIEGGGMRGVVSGGMVTALDFLRDFRARSISWSGTSAGALAGAFFLSAKAAADGDEHLPRRPDRA